MKHKSILTIAIVFTVLCIAMAGTASAKSLYVIADINGNPTPINSYDISGTTLVYQATNTVPRLGGGGVGLAIDTDSEYLFVTYEFSNEIHIVNAKTMQSEGSTTAPGARNLAGIVVDQDLSKVYTMDRDTNKLYVYSWNAGTKMLALDGSISLSGVVKAHGIALDEVNNLLYVGDLTTSIKVFNTGSWTQAGTLLVSQKAMGIAVDVANGYVYTGNAYPPYGSLGLLSKYDLNTNTESTVNIRELSGGVTSDNVLGLAVDQSTGLLYITTGNQGTGGSDRIMVFNSNLNNLYATSDIGNPTGIVVPSAEISYNPLNLAKSDSPDPVSPGGTLTYTISYQNTNNFPVDNVVITDTLPSGVTFVSATGGGTHSAGVVTWNIGTLTSSTAGSVQVVVTVDAGTSGTIVNSAKIDSDQTPPTTQNEPTTVRTNGEIPEFPTIALPIAAILGLMFLFQRRKE